MGLKVVITGASGMVGKGVLLECLDSSAVEKVLTVSRSPIGVAHPKHEELLVRDFMAADAFAEKLKGYDACYFCAGTTSVGKTEELYTQVTYDLTMNFAKQFIAQSPDSVFCYVSGAGTDSTEQGRSMWARVKGRTENAIMAMPFKAAYAFRPGYIQPYRGIRSKMAWANVLYVLLWPLYQLLKLIPGAVTDTISIGKAMLYVTQHRPPVRVVGNRDMNAFARG